MQDQEARSRAVVQARPGQLDLLQLAQHIAAEVEDGALIVDQRAYLNRMLRLALPFFRRRNILRENASSNARYPGLVGYAISCSSCAVDMDQ